MPRGLARGSPIARSRAVDELERFASEALNAKLPAASSRAGSSTSGDRGLVSDSLCGSEFSSGRSGSADASTIELVADDSGVEVKLIVAGIASAPPRRM